MPFHGSSTQHNAQHMPPSAASGIFQVAQALGSIGAPSGNLRTVTSGTTSVSSDSLYYSNTSLSNSHTGGQPAPPSSHNMPQSSSTTNAPILMSVMNNSQQDETPRRPPAYGRQSDELHMSPLADRGQRTQMSPRDYTGSGPPRISLEQATPETSHYQRVPGSLQPGGSSRPGPISANTAPTMPTISQSLSQDPYSTPSRTNPLGPSHNYSRSSPSAGYDGQNYIPFSTTPSGADQYSSPTSQKYTPVNQRNISNTPLGLADIRPRADSSLSDSLPGANPYSYDGASAIPTNSNYLAPWAIYAFDWCKWPAQNNDAGKVAVGSYLEDGHNFVSCLPTQPALYLC
jgi:DDB1- and CUL4-associated factor 7